MLMMNYCLCDFMRPTFRAPRSFFVSCCVELFKNLFGLGVIFMINIYSKTKTTMINHGIIGTRLWHFLNNTVYTACRQILL